MPSVFLDGVSKMVKNTGSVEIHGTQTGVTMVSSRSREAITNAVLNPKWLVVFQWTAKTFTFKISRIYPAILNRLFKIWNYNNVLYVFCTWNKQYTCRKFWTSCFSLHYESYRIIHIHRIIHMFSSYIYDIFISYVLHSWFLDLTLTIWAILCDCWARAIKYRAGWVEICKYWFAYKPLR